MPLRSWIGRAVKVARRTNGSAAADDEIASNTRTALGPLAPLVLSAVHAQPAAPPAPVFTTEARRRHASQVLFGVGPAVAVLPAAAVPLVQGTNPWWTPTVPPRSGEGEGPKQGEMIVDEQLFPVLTIDGAVRELRRRVYLRAGGRRRKTYDLLVDGAVAPEWDSGSLALYAAERLPGDGGQVVVAEGAPAAERLLGWGITAVGTLTGALRTPPGEALSPLVRFPDVVLWPDNDEVGVRHMENIGAVLTSAGATRVRMVRWVGGPFHGDAADVKDADGARALVAAAEEWHPGRLVLSTVRQAPRPAVRVPNLLELSAIPPEPLHLTDKPPHEEPR